MNELDKLKAQNAKLQRQNDSLLREKIHHQLIALQLAGRAPNRKGLH